MTELLLIKRIIAGVDDVELRVWKTKCLRSSLTLKFLEEMFMTYRSVIMTAAAGLLASLAFAAPSRAGVAFSYTITPVGTQTITAASVGTGSASTTFTAQAPGSGTTDLVLDVAKYTQTATGNGITIGPPVIANGGLYSAAVTVSQKVTITYGAFSGFFTITENQSGFAYSGITLNPGVISSGPIILGSEKFSIYQQGTTTNNGSGKSFVQIGITATAVPEPTSMALLGIGMTSFLAFRRFFKRTPVA